jgi:hypothetical protein
VENLVREALPTVLPAAIAGWHRGTFTAGEEYEAGAAVTKGGSLWLSTRATAT